MISALIFSGYPLVRSRSVNSFKWISFSFHGKSGWQFLRILRILRSQLSKSNPWPRKTCGSEKCFPCKEEGGGNCRRKNVGYVITCKECKTEYHGETSRNMFSRGEEHLRALSKKSPESVLWNHCVTVHNEQMTTFSMKATGYFTDALTRQINEAVRIQHCKRSMNRKGEWRKAAVPHALFIRQ